MDIQNIVKDLQKWQEENKENRSVIIITSECIAKSEGGGKRTSASLIGVYNRQNQMRRNSEPDATFRWSS